MGERAQHDRQPDRGAHARRRGRPPGQIDERPPPNASLRRVAALRTLLALACAAHAPARASYRWKLPRGFSRARGAGRQSHERREGGARRAVVRRSAPVDHRPVFLPELPFARSAHSPTGCRVRAARPGETLPLNAPTLLNVAYNASLGWRDANVRTLEQQMRGPLFNEHPRELGLAGREAARRARLVGGRGDWCARFARGVPRANRAPVTMDNVIRAIAAYERTLFAGALAVRPLRFRAAITGRSASGRRPACSCSSRRAPAARPAMAASISPATGWIANITSAEPVFADTGTGQWRCACPRCATSPATAPYMHDGRFATLDAVLDHYERLAVDPAADARLRRAPLTTVERAAACGSSCCPSRDKSEVTRRASRTGVCLRASMNLDTTFGRHLLLPHPVSRARRRAGPGA